MQYGKINLFFKNNSFFLILFFSAIIFVFVLSAFLLPLLSAFFPFVSRSFNFDICTSSVETSAYRIFEITCYTLLQAFLSSSVAVILGVIGAFFCSTRYFFGRKFLLSLSAIPFSIPPMIIALAYIIFFGKNGFLNSLLNIFGIHGGNQKTFFNLYSFTGVIIIHSFYNFPIALNMITQVWERLDEDIENAALLLGANRLRIFFTIVLPEIINSILSAFFLIFIYCFFSFVIVLLFGGLGVTTLEVELYRAAKITFDIPAAGKFVLIEVITGLILTLIYMYFREAANKNMLTIKQKRTRKKIENLYEYVFFILFIFIIILFLIAPLLSIFTRSFYENTSAYNYKNVFSLHSWITVLKRLSFWKAFFNTCILGICTAFLSVISALFYIYGSLFSQFYCLKKRTSFKKYINILLKNSLPYLPLMISSVVMGFGFTVLIKKGSVLVLVFAQSAAAWIFAYTQICNSFLQIPENILQSGILLSNSKADCFFRVVIPLCTKGIKSAFAFCFAISAGDASLPIVLGIPNFENLSLLIYRLSGAYRFTESAVTAVILAIITGSVFYLGCTDKSKYKNKDYVKV